VQPEHLDDAEGWTGFPVAQWSRLVFTRSLCST
jgi:hypothetical protein